MSYSPNIWKTGDVITSNKLNNIEGGIESVNESYLPTTWKTGDVITAEKLNHIEDGIAESVIPKVEEKDVNFYDYDGTVVYSYTAEEFAALDALPDNPTHEGLTAQGWNWSLADAKTYVASYGKLNVGQMYITESGATEIDVELDGILKSPYLGIGINGTVTIDWGDGSAQDTTTGSDVDTTVFIQHNYLQGGKYTISITPAEGTTIQINGVPYDDNDEYYCGSILLCRTNETLVEGFQQGCYSIRIIELRIGVGVTTIGEWAFQSCSALTSITIPSSVTTIGESAFSNCYSLISITIPSNVTSIGEGAFVSCIALTSITIPSSVTSIGADAFRNCSVLTSVTIPSSVVTIEAGALYGCSVLTSVTIPSSVVTIEDEAFASCSTLTSVTIPSSVTSIGSNMLTFCYTLTSVTIPSSVTSIGSWAFTNCYSLKEIHLLPETPPELHDGEAGPTFDDIQPDAIFYVPQGTLETYQNATGWSTYASQMQEEPS